MIKVSYIVPVYNVEKYLAECLESLVNQSIDSKEIILIDDGSTDNSLNICRMYEQKYDFVKVIHKENEGQSCARNLGIIESKGKYIQFVDSDDIIDINCSEEMYYLCEKYSLDMIRGKYHVYFEEENKNEKNNLSNFYYNKRDEIVENARSYFKRCIENNKYEVTPILGLIKREYLIKNKISFAANLKMEDHEFTLKCLTYSSDAKIMQIDYCFYTYRRRANSTTTVPSISSINDIIKISKLMIAYIEDHLKDQELVLMSNRAVSALIYQATSIYGRLEKKERKKVRIPLNVLIFSIENSISRYIKIKLILFTYLRFVVDIVYNYKLKDR